VRLRVEPLESRDLLTGSWTPLAHAAPDSIGVMLLLSDGTVMAVDTGPSVDHNMWYRLTPASSGSYVNSYINGTWAPPQTLMPMST
jgi:hypothetical protein